MDINSSADAMLNKINLCVQDSLKNTPSLRGAIVNSVNSDGTVNVYIPPNSDVVFTNILNQTPFEVNVGDSVELMLKNGSYSNCWIVAKHTKTNIINSEKVNSAVSAVEQEQEQSNKTISSLEKKQEEIENNLKTKQNTINAIGASNKGIYFSEDGIASACSYEVNKAVPSNAEFTDTLNTAGATDTSDKIFLIGAAEQNTNSQTYTDDEVFVTNGTLTTKSVNLGENCSIQWNSTTNSIDFIFS